MVEQELQDTNESLSDQTCTNQAIQGAWKSVPLPDQKGTPRKKSLRDRLSALFGGA